MKKDLLWLGLIETGSEVLTGLQGRSADVVVWERQLVGSDGLGGDRTGQLRPTGFGGSGTEEWVVDLGCAESTGRPKD